MKPFNNKLQMLKSILSGTESLAALMPPKQITVYCEDGIYKVFGKQMTKQEYENWLTTVDPRDTVVLWIEQKSYSDGNEPLTDQHPYGQPQPQSKPLSRKERKRLAKATPPAMPVKMPVIQAEEPKLIPLEKHNEFNTMMYNKIFYNGD